MQLWGYSRWFKVCKLATLHVHCNKKCLEDHFLFIFFPNGPFLGSTCFFFFGFVNLNLDCTFCHNKKKKTEDSWNSEFCLDIGQILSGYDNFWLIPKTWGILGSNTSGKQELILLLVKLQSGRSFARKSLDSACVRFCVVLASQVSLKK